MRNTSKPNGTHGKLEIAGVHMLLQTPDFFLEIVTLYPDLELRAESLEARERCGRNVAADRKDVEHLAVLQF
jgi:hypothetical protein